MSFNGFEDILNEITTKKKEGEKSNTVVAEKCNNDDNNEHASKINDILVNFDIDDFMQNDNTHQIDKNENKSDKRGKQNKNNEKYSDISKKLSAGHRQRARERFLLAPDDVSDCDLLELILFLIIPRADTKPVAKTLINKFKTIRNVFNAQVESLNSCGVNSGAIKYLHILLSSLCKKLLKQEFNEKSELDSPEKNRYENEEDIIIGSEEALIKYCQTTVCLLKEEEFHIIFLNSKLKIIDDKKFGNATSSDVLISMREIVKTAIALGTHSIILYHNHPNGDVNPSSEDVVVTDKFVKIFQAIAVDVIDHIILSGNKYYSFYENHILKKIRSAENTDNNTNNDED